MRLRFQFALLLLSLFLIFYIFILFNGPKWLKLVLCWSALWLNWKKKNEKNEIVMFFFLLYFLVNDFPYDYFTYYCQLCDFHFKIKSMSGSSIDESFHFFFYSYSFSVQRVWFKSFTNDSHLKAMIIALVSSSFQFFFHFSFFLFIFFYWEKLLFSFYKKKKKTKNISFHFSIYLLLRIKGTEKIRKTETYDVYDDNNSVTDDKADNDLYLFYALDFHSFSSSSLLFFISLFLFFLYHMFFICHVKRSVHVKMQSSFEEIEQK